MNVRTVSAALLLAIAAGAARAADWNQWRGPNRDGRIPGFKAPAAWPAKLEQVWKVKVGIGHASPLIIGKAAYVFSREGGDEITRRLDLETGKEVWRDSYPAPYEMHPSARGHGEGPKSTPLYANDRIYTLGISGILSSLDGESGRVMWRRDFSQRFPKTSPLFGTAASPLYLDGMVIAPVGGHDNGALIAFDANTSAERWRWQAPEDGPAYTSPILTKVGGVSQIVTQSQKLSLGVDPKTGKLLWSLPFTTPYDQNSVTPVAVGDLLVFGGTRQPTVAIRVKRDGETWKAEKAWEVRDATLYMSTPVASGNRLYGMSERYKGQLFTIDWTTGKTEWTGTAGLGDNAAVFEAGSTILALTTDGDLRVYRKDGATLVEAARYDVAEGATWASPAIAGSRMLIKDIDSLYLWQLPR